MSTLPALVYFEDDVPTVYPKKKSLASPEEISRWMENVMERDQIEEVNGRILQKVCILRSKLVMFCNYNEFNVTTLFKLYLQARSQRTLMATKKQFVSIRRKTKLIHST